VVGNVEVNGAPCIQRSVMSPFNPICAIPRIKRAVTSAGGFGGSILGRPSGTLRFRHMQFER
jgi:hypothetical protein